jgi:cytosine/adenosine deaminase-related metal-dependent hydrolase
VASLWIADGLLVTPVGRRVFVGTRSILVESGIIEGILPAGSAPPPRAEVIDGSDMVVIPGLVNAHVHSHGVLSKWVVDTLPLEMWVPYVTAVRMGMTAEEARLGPSLVGIDCLLSGVTTVLDHVANTGVLFDAAVQAYIDIGIRAALAPLVSDLPYPQTVVAPERGRESLHPAPWPTVENPRELLEHTARCVDAWHEAKGRISILAGPSAPERCSVELLRGLERLARDRGIGIHTHLLETKGQALMAQRLYGMSITEFLEGLGLLTDRTSVAHAVWVSRDDLARLANRGTTVVHNPLSNLTLGSGVMPLLAMREERVNIALGTDSSNAGGNHSLFESMRLATALPRVAEPDPTRWVSAEEIFSYATAGGARALGMESKIGSVEVGKEADLVLLRRRSVALSPLNHVVRQLVFCEVGESVDTVIVRGRIVVRGRKVQTVDESALIDEASRVAEEAIARNRIHLEWARSQESYMRAVHAAVRGAEWSPPLWSSRLLS